MMKNIKIGMIAAVSACALAVKAADVKKPSIQPSWSGAKVATWTMDYEAALANAKAEGKYTIMMFSGMWWCPHCQFLEKKVLSTAGWKAYAEALGFYETVLDFPNRKGTGYWCWLWDEDYRADAGLTAEDAAEELIKRYDVQDAYSEPDSIRQTATNMVVMGTYKKSFMYLYEPNPSSVYTRVGYPTMIVLDPAGKELGRFSPDKDDKVYASNPLGWVMSQINAIVPEAPAPITTAGQYSGYTTDAAGALAGTVTCKAGKPNQKTYLSALTFAFTSKAGKRTSIKTNVYYADGVSASVTDKAGNKLDFTLYGESISGTLNGDSFWLARDVFTEDAAAAVRLLGVKGNWSLVVNGEFDYEKGCRACGSFEEGVANRALLTVAIGVRGKTKISGTTSAGTKISVSSQLMYAECGTLYLPVVEKKSGMSFVLVIDENDVGSLMCAANEEKLVAFGQPVAALEEPLYFTCDDGTAAQVAVTNGRRMSASSIKLNLTYTTKTGACKGSYRNDFGTSVSLNGIFVGTTGYFTATPRGGDPIEALVSPVRPENLTEDGGDECDDCHF